MFCEILVNFCVSWYRLGNFRCWILIPVVVSSMPDKDTAHHFNLFYQITPFQETWSSATLRMQGMFPLVSSL
jgi:hypothetical protein